MAEGYARVMPRDLFNESQLLKCLGMLSLHVHDGRAGRGTTMTHEDPESGFTVAKDDADGSLYCPTIKLRFADETDVLLYAPLNSRRPCPLQFWAGVGEEGDVFDDGGRLSLEFRDAISRHDHASPEGS